MTKHSLQRLQYLCDIIPPLLEKIPESDFSEKPAPGKWSKKEILGHLLDSATNNHHRFVRTQFENLPTIVYDQDKWNSSSRYDLFDSKHLIVFWTAYNRHLIELIKHIPKEGLAKECNTGGETPKTLEWLFDDYVVHLEHHLKEMVDY